MRGQPVGRLRQPLRVLAPHRVHRLGGVPQPLGVLAHLVQPASRSSASASAVHPALQPSPVLAHPGRQDSSRRPAGLLGPGRVGDQPVEGGRAGRGSGRTTACRRRAPIPPELARRTSCRAGCGPGRRRLVGSASIIARSRSRTTLASRASARARPSHLISSRMGSVTSRSTSGRYVASAERSRRQATRAWCTPSSRRRRIWLSRRFSSVTCRISRRCSIRPAGRFGPTSGSGTGPRRAIAEDMQDLRLTALGWTPAPPSARPRPRGGPARPRPARAPTPARRPGRAASGVPVTWSSASSASTVPSSASRFRRVRRVPMVAIARVGPCPPRRPRRGAARRGEVPRPGQRNPDLVAPLVGGDLEVPTLVRAACPAAQRNTGPGQREVGGVEVDRVQLVHVRRPHL